MTNSISPFKFIQKRDGRHTPFDAARITSAIARAGQATGEFDKEVAEQLTEYVINRLNFQFSPQTLLVELVQDVVEDVLLDSPYRATAKAYLLYRAQRTQGRDLTNSFDTAKTKLIDSYIKQSDWKTRENSNMGYSLQGLNNYISSYVSSEYWLNNIYTPAVRQAHRQGDLHIHDLNQLSVYCVGWDLLDLIKEGFKGVASNIESAPPRHFRSALGQLVNFFYTLQGEAAGAQAVSSFDTLLAPFVRYDNLDYQKVFQCLQEFVFNINIPTRVGFQAPFTNITMDLTAPTIYRQTPVVVGGENKKEVYGDFQEEMNLINRAFAEVMMKGDNKGRVFTFPIPTYNIVKDFDWNNPHLDSVWRMTGRYGIPYFSNFVNSDMSPDDARSMCCRLRLDTRELRKRGGGLFGANPLTGSIGVVTLNLPRLGYLSRSVEEFTERLDKLLEIARESLTIKRKVLEGFSDGGLYPYTEFYLRSVKEASGKFWSNHFSTVGVVGTNEACLNLLGDDISTHKGRAFALQLLNHIRARLAQFQVEEGDLFNLEATPAEGTSYRLARLDLERYPNMIFANGLSESQNKTAGFAPFYTNSSHLPVDYSDDLFEVLEHQDPLQCCYTGGTVIHSFLGEQITDPRLVRDLVKKITSNFKLPYFTITPTFSICSDHGYLPGEHRQCPKCEAPTDVYSRVVGYLRPVSRWNDGKQAEFAVRKTYRQELSLGHSLRVTEPRPALVKKSAYTRPHREKEKEVALRRPSENLDSGLPVVNLRGDLHPGV
ncbi:MAG: ribonucleoside triphosphate reductase [Deltaproteobacteria bacterium]|jgi:ribonucleoside-triphosphate reductase|nr:ribonucleoside triphosphate reductase [Deltaproteobacteria bacterium]